VNDNYIVTSIEDYFGFLQAEKKYSYKDIIMKYELNKEVGTGIYERIILNPQLEVGIMNYTFNKDIIMLYDLSPNYFEIAYCNEGKMIIYEENIGVKKAFDEHKISINVRESASGYMKYLKGQKYKTISIYTNKSYVEKLLEPYADNICFKSIWNSINDKTSNELYLGNIANTQQVKIFEEIMSCTLPNMTRLLYLNGKVMELIASEFEKLIEGFSINNSSICIKSYDIEKLELARKLIVEHMENPLSINELAREVGLNTNKLKKGFKCLYNKTIFGYLRDKKMEKAKELLLSEEKTIAQIASEIGYANPSQFSAAFKKKYGINPKELQKKVEFKITG
jgi:AraC-like DNA-binding protein